MPGPHDKIIAHEAKLVLGPVGFRQKGRSRLWFSDHGWWVRVVEFQPSSWSKGSYLNVAAHWLWNEGGYVSFDFGGRVSEHEKYESDEQFRVAAVGLAKKAASAAEQLRITFPSLDAAADVLLKEVRAGHGNRNGHPGWPAYHAGIASAFIGRAPDAREMFKLVRSGSAQPESVLSQAAATMSDLVSDPLAFRARVNALIEAQRLALKLPKKSNVAEAPDTIASN